MTPNEERHAAELRERIRQNASDAFNEVEQWKSLALTAIMAALLEGVVIVWALVKLGVG